MNKKVTIFAAALILVGTIGTISSSIAAVPFLTDYANKVIIDANKEHVIYEKAIDVNKLNITTRELSVEVKQSNSDKLIVAQSGKINNPTFTLDNKENEFVLKQNYKDPNFTVQGFGEFIINNLDLGSNKIVVYVPNNVDVQVNTQMGSLILDDKSILLDKVGFNTNYGSIVLPKGIKNLKNLNISSASNLDLKLSEIIGFENVNISTEGSVYIDSMPDDIFIENIEKYIPKTFNIVSSRYGSDIDINTSAPIGQNVTIDNKSGYVSLKLPTDYYNIKFNLLASQDIITEDVDSNSQSNNNLSGSMKQFEGTFRDAKENEIQYNIDVKSSTINLIK